MGRSVETSVLSLEPSISLLAFVQRQISQAEPYNGKERRAESRQLLVKPVLVYPADNRFNPIGPARVMVIRDISPRGLALAHEKDDDWPLVLLRISLPEIEALVGALMIWSRPVGPFYLTGYQIHPEFDSILPDDC